MTLEVICGPMFSGKSEELMRRVRRAMAADLKVSCFHPAIDNRYSDHEIVSHSGLKIPSLGVTKAWMVAEASGADLIALDEAQFFMKDVLEVVLGLRKIGNRIIVAGLDRDFRGSIFGCMDLYLAYADKVDKLTAVCSVCKDDNATYTQRLINGNPAPIDSDTIQIGGEESYEARCWKCHELSS